MKTLKLTAILFLSLAVCACSNDDNNGNGNGEAGNNVVDYQFLNATSYTDWVYFSFEEGKIVSVTDFENDLSWDIAFHRGDVRLNGGASGNGQGAAINMQTTSWSSITSAPMSGYITDALGTITTAFTGDGIETEEQPYSLTLGAWLTIDTSNPPPVYTYHDWIFVVKSANGEYVKLTIYDYKDAKNSGAYISFKYQYAQEDGQF